MNTYHIKEGYLHKTPAPVKAGHGGYWTGERIRASHFHQYQVYQFAGREIARRRPRSVLDVGCGPGTKLAMLHASFPNVEYYGVDLEEAIAYCRATHPFGRWQVQDFNVAPDGSAVPMDLVICSDVIEHVNDPDQLLEYIRQRLSKDGRLILSTPERDVLNGRESMSAPNEYHMREWNFAEIEAYVRSRGYEVEDHRLQFPVRFWPNSIFYREVVLRAIKLRPLRYNQVLLLRAN